MTEVQPDPSFALGSPKEMTNQRWHAPPKLKEIGNMVAQTECNELASARGKIAVVLIAASLLAQSAGCAQQVSTADCAETATNRNAARPLTIEIAPSGDIVKVTNADGVLLPIQDYPPTNQARLKEEERLYRFGSGLMANPDNPSVPIQAVCLWKNKESKEFCWPKDRPAWVILKNKQIEYVYFLSERGKSTYAGRPIGPPRPFPGKLMDMDCCCVQTFNGLVCPCC
jgi:hypothetical protein